MGKSTKNTLIISTITGVVALIVGYVLGAYIGFWNNGSSSSKWAGTYTNDSWNGRTASIVLNSDGTCEQPNLDYALRKCTYEVKDGKVYFNNEESSTTAIGDTGIVYHDHVFTKLK